MPQGQRYTLFGFSKELDWRPLHFVEPIPAHRICNVCGLLPRVTVFLPCRHVVCTTCYGQSLVDDEHNCPLDGDQFFEEDAERRVFPPENLLRRKVKCWNEDSGCDVVMAASDVHKHFYEDCVHHSVRCPECSASVLCNNVSAHRRSDCSSYAAQNLAEHLNPSNNTAQEEMLTALETIVEKRVAEMRSGIAKILRDSSVHCDRLNDISHFQNSLRETVMLSSEKQTRAIDEARIAFVQQVNEDLTEQRGRLNEVSHYISALRKEVKVAVVDAAGKCFDKLEEMNAEIRRQFTTNDNRLKKVSETVSAFEGALGKALGHAMETLCQNCATNADCIAKANDTESDQDVSDMGRNLLAPDTLNVHLQSYEFCVNELKSLKEMAMSRGTVDYYSDPIYLCGYCISPGVSLIECWGRVRVFGIYRLHKGELDEFLEWPFKHQVTLVFDKFYELETEFSQNLESLGRPKESMNQCVMADYGYFLKDLKHVGLTTRDQLKLKLEFVPPKPK